MHLDCGHLRTDCCRNIILIILNAPRETVTLSVGIHTSKS